MKKMSCFFLFCVVLYTIKPCSAHFDFFLPSSLRDYDRVRLPQEETFARKKYSTIKTIFQVANRFIK